MAVYIVSTEPAGREIAHRDESSAGAFLCTKEFADQYSLMHYRRGGEKKGVRRWQNEDGSYTSEGYKHYAEMYGWGKFRADRAEKKAEKYEDKAKKAEAELHKQQVRIDKAQVKADRKGNAKNAQKVQVATNKLHEAQLRLDQYRNKAEKYQNKTDQIHKKWDEKQDRLDKYLNEDGTLNEKAMAKYTYSNGVQSKMNLAGRLKFGSKFAEEFDKQQLDAAKKRGDTDRAKVNAEFDKLVDQEIADRKAAVNTPTSDPAERFVGEYGAKKNGDEKRTLVDIGRRRIENAKMEEEQSKILKSQEGFSNDDNYKKYCQLDAKISQNYEEIEKDLNNLGLTSYETRFENAAYKVTEDRAVMSQIKRILDNDGDGELHSTAADYNEQSSHCRGLYKTYSEQWGKDHPGKAWDGDGSEFHEELCQKYPEYKKGYDELDRRITKFVKEILAESKKPEFGSIKGLDKYLNFFDQYGTADSSWYRVGDVKGYAIMAALTNPETSFQEIFPQMFFVDHDKNGEFLQNSVWLAELK